MKKNNNILNQRENDFFNNELLLLTYLEETKDLEEINNNIEHYAVINRLIKENYLWSAKARKLYSKTKKYLKGTKFDFEMIYPKDSNKMAMVKYPTQKEQNQMNELMKLAFEKLDKELETINGNNKI